MNDYFKGAFDFNNPGINREKSIFLNPKASPLGGLGGNKSSSPKKQTAKADNKPAKSKTTSKKPTSKSDESARAMKYWNMKAEMNRTEQEKDRLKTEFDKEMEILNRHEVADILEDEKSLKDPYFKDLRSMDKEQATKKLINDYEDLEIERGKSSANSKEVLSKRGGRLLKNNQQHISMALSDTAFLNDLNVDTDLYYKGIGSQKANNTEKIVTSNHAVARLVRTLPTELQSEAMNNYFRLQETSLDDAISYIKNLSSHHSYDNDTFVKNILSTPYQTNSSGNTFNDWKAQQRFKGLSGNDQDNMYYTNKIVKGEKYNNLQNEEDFDTLAEKGREIFWGATLNDLKMDEIKDKQVAAHHMTEKEIKTYAYLWGKYGETQARNYLDFLTDDLKLRKSDYDTKKAQEFAEEHPALATASTAPAAFIGDLQSAGNIAGRFLDEKIHPGLYKPTEVVLADNSVNRRTDTILGTVSENIENDVYRKAYDAVTTIYHEFAPDILYSTYAPYLLTIDEFGESAEADMKLGASTTEATLNGISAAAINFATGKAPKLKVVDDMVEKSLSLATENKILGENSLYNKRAIEYYNNGMNSYEANRHAMADAYFDSPLYNLFFEKDFSNQNTSTHNSKNSITGSTRKNAWEMSNAEFDTYINNIMNQE